LRLLIQRVTRASVRVDGKLESTIESGLLVFAGIAATDSKREADYLAEKLIHLRVFSDTDGRMNLSALDVRGEILLVSQFTLYADCRKGRRPSFDLAAPPDAARELYAYLLESVRQKSGLVVRNGVFQTHMEVELVNDGPVTLILES
jgi:D-tyrosyl-tRNA(Tyr) deacylase